MKFKLIESLNEDKRNFKPHTLRLLKLINSDLLNDSYTESVSQFTLNEDINDGTVHRSSKIISGIDGSHLTCILENAVPGTTSFLGEYIDGDSAGTKYIFVYCDDAGTNFVYSYFNTTPDQLPTEIFEVDGEDKGSYMIFTEDEIKNISLINNNEINEDVEKVDVYISDKDIIDMNERNGDITISDTTLEFTPELPVVIKFDEDTDNTVHKFIMKSHDEEAGVIILAYEHADILTEALLMEGPFDKIKKAVANHKADKATKKALAMDNTNAAKEWTYIINGKSMNHADAMKHSEEERANAIVLDHGFYVRRGTEDLSDRLIRYTKNNAEVTSTYSSKEDRKRVAQDEKEQKAKEREDEKEQHAKEKQDEKDARAKDKEDADALRALDKINLRDYALTLDGDPVSFGDYIAMSDEKKARVQAINKKGQKLDSETLAQATQRYLDKRNQKETDRLAAQKDKEERAQAKADAKQAKLDDKAAKKAEDEIAKAETTANKNTYKKVKNTLGNADTSRRTAIKPKGTLTFYPASKADRNTADRDAQSIDAKKYAKLSTEEKRKYIGVDSKGSEFSYQQLLNFKKKAKKFKMESLDEDYGDYDPIYNLIEELFIDDEDDTDMLVEGMFVDTIPGDELISGWINNVPDDEIDAELTNLENIATKLNLNRVEDLAILIDEDMFYDPANYHFVASEETPQGAKKYEIEGIEFFVQPGNGGYFLYFTSEEAANRYAKIIHDENEF